ncbi:1-Cys peroxiredoxin [Sphingomonas rubra]|uniref:Alkyl hydroperoxide reductase C n=2 Tax=Sphingomonas rubra TaxID=634430 RepID=A0A1I5R9X2_9SPHN|nr:1-Cys peroxiredoxin [Sphingomonas rubra]
MGDVSLRDYRGRWLILFSHPADFTPVCTSEFVALARAADAFAAQDCALLGLSVDSLYSHLAWIAAIRERFGVAIPFPIVEDPSMAVGAAYGMIETGAADSASVRAVYFIDPEGVIRAMTWYPLSVGRSVEEMLRLLSALRRTAAGDVLAPEGWRPGQDLLLPAPQDATALADLHGDEPWFYRRRPDA